MEEMTCSYQETIKGQWTMDSEESKTIENVKLECLKRENCTAIRKSHCYQFATSLYYSYCYDVPVPEKWLSENGDQYVDYGDAVEESPCIYNKTDPKGNWISMQLYLLQLIILLIRRIDQPFPITF